MIDAIGWLIITAIIIVPLYLVVKKYFGKDDSKQLDSIRKKTTPKRDGNFRYENEKNYYVLYSINIKNLFEQAIYYFLFPISGKFFSKNSGLSVLLS